MGLLVLFTVEQRIVDVVVRSLAAARESQSLPSSKLALDEVAAKGGR